MRTRKYVIGGRVVEAETKKSRMGNRRVVTGPPPLWTVRQLPPLLVGDRLAFKAEPGFEEWAVARQGAVTWHWALVGVYLPADEYSGEDYQIIGSISKGVATELLSAYGYRHMRVYRSEMQPGEQEKLAVPILKRCAHYGAYEYNWLGVTESAVTYLLKDFGIKIHLPVSHRFYCIQFDARIWQDFYNPLVKDWEHVTPYDMENSPKQKVIWGTF